MKFQYQYLIIPILLVLGISTIAFFNLFPLNPSNTELIVIGTEGQVEEFSISSIRSLPSVRGFSSYENSFGNWGGKGNYTGVPISICA